MALVVAVLDQAAAWLTASGIKQWPDRFETEWVAPSVERGETWLVRIDGRTAGTVTLDWSDPMWSDRALRSLAAEGALIDVAS